MDDKLHYQRVVIVLRKKNTRKVMLKSFKFIPRGSLQVLFTKNQKRIGFLIVDRAESDAFTSSILLYCALLHESIVAENGRPTLSEVDDKIERWIGEFTGLKNMEFDEGAKHLGTLHILSESVDLIIVLSLDPRRHQSERGQRQSYASRVNDRGH